MPAIVQRTEAEAGFKHRGLNSIYCSFQSSKLCPRQKQDKRRTLRKWVPSLRASPSERTSTAAQQGLCNGRTLLSSTWGKNRQISDMTLRSRETRFSLENVSGVKGQSCWKNSVVIPFRRLRLETVFILFRKEAVDVKELAGSRSERCWEAVSLTEDGGRCCGLGLGVQKKVGQGLWQVFFCLKK